MGLPSSSKAHVVAISQPNYIPWKGYFDLIAAVDEFVLLDDVQYTRRDWRNRNRIKTPQGLAWLTIPVQVKGRYLQRIDQTLVSDPTWADQHWARVRQSYETAPAFQEVASVLADCFVGHAGEALTDVTDRFLRPICTALGIDTPLRHSHEMQATGSKGERILNLCEELGATHYVSGPAARDYLEPSEFQKRGISLLYFDYTGYPEYEQLYPPFEHFVSILDLLVHVGFDDAFRWMKSGTLDVDEFLVAA